MTERRWFDVDGGHLESRLKGRRNFGGYTEVYGCADYTGL